VVKLQKPAIAVLIAIFACPAQTAPSPVLAVQPDLLVTRGDGFTPAGCQFAQASMAQALKTLRPPLRDWRFVVVPDARWPEACKAFRLKPCVPAFSNFAIRATYLTSRLAVLIDHGRVDEDLIRYSKLTGEARLESVLAHELGHILCGTADQEIADDAGRRWRASRRMTACVAGKVIPQMHGSQAIFR
jgi:hypothetical protein